MRPAGPHDAPVIADLERRSAHTPWSVQAVSSSLAAPGTRALLVGDPPIGHVLFTVAADEGEILTVVVAPEARRQGHGGALLRAVQDEWRRLGVATGWLEVRADNEGALCLYEAAGWAATGRRKAYYADGVDAVVCRWSA